MEARDLGDLETSFHPVRVLADYSRHSVHLGAPWSTYVILLVGLPNLALAEAIQV